MHKSLCTAIPCATVATMRRITPHVFAFLAFIGVSLIGFTFAELLLYDFKPAWIMVFGYFIISIAGIAREHFTKKAQP